MTAVKKTNKCKCGCSMTGGKCSGCKGKPCKCKHGGKKNAKASS